MNVREYVLGQGLCAEENALMCLRGSSHQVDGQTVLTIAGAVGTPEAAIEFEYLIADASGSGYLVLDLTEVSVFGAAGSAVLARTSCGAERELVVVIGERYGAVLRAVESAHITTRVRLFESLEHALVAAASGSTDHRWASRDGRLLISPAGVRTARSPGLAHG